MSDEHEMREAAFERGVMLTKLEKIESEVGEHKNEIKNLRGCISNKFEIEAEERRKLELSLKKLLWSLGAAFLAVQSIPILREVLDGVR